MNAPQVPLMHIGLVAAQQPQRTAVVNADGAALLSYEALDRRSRQLAIHLRNRGLVRGDHIAVLMRNSPEYLVVLWAAQRSGLYFTPLSWHLTVDEVRYVVEDCGAKALFVSPADAEVGETVLVGNARVEVRLVDGASVGLFEPLSSVYESVDAAAALDECEGVSMCYSSGTTGRPKGIKRPAAFPPLGTPAPQDMLLRHFYGLNGETVNLQIAPMYHAAPLAWAMATTRFGGTLVLMEKFDAKATLENVERHKVTHLHMVPTMMVRVMDLPEPERRRFDLSSLKCLAHAAAPCPPEVKRSMIDWLGPIVAEYYAGSEGIGMTFVGSADWLAHPRTVGCAVYGKIHILDDEGNELPTGEVGTIYFGGTPAFEYHNDPEKTRKVFSQQGYATYGDFGYVDADGFLFIEDRRTDLILSGGVNIYPRETEEALLAHPSVYDVAVIGVPNVEFGQDVMAVVELHPGFVASAALAAELIEFSRSRIAHFKCPRRVEFQPLPRTATGKLLRRQLKEQFSVNPTTNA